MRSMRVARPPPKPALSEALSPLMRSVTSIRPRRNPVRSMRSSHRLRPLSLHGNFKFKTALKSWICWCFRDSEVRTGPVASAAIFGIGHSCTRNENCDRALNAPTKALKNARIRRPFKGNKQWLAADVRGYETAFPGPLWHSYPTRTRIAGEETDMSGHVSRT